MVDKTQRRVIGYKPGYMFWLCLFVVMLFEPLTTYAVEKQYVADRVPLPLAQEMFQQELHEDGSITGAYSAYGAGNERTYFYLSADGILSTFEVIDVKERGVIAASPIGQYAFLLSDEPTGTNGPLTYRLSTFQNDEHLADYVLEDIIPELQRDKHSVSKMIYDNSGSLILTGYMKYDGFSFDVPFIIKKNGAHFTYEKHVQLRGTYLLGVDTSGVALAMQTLHSARHLSHVGRIASTRLPLQALNGMPYETIHRTYPSMVSDSGALITQTEKSIKNIDSLFVREEGSDEYKELLVKRRVKGKRSKNRAKSGLLSISAINNTEMVGELGKLGPVVVDMQKRNTLRGRKPLSRITANFPSNCSMSRASDLNQHGEILVKALCSDNDRVNWSLFLLSPK